MQRNTKRNTRMPPTQSSTRMWTTPSYPVRQIEAIRIAEQKKIIQNAANFYLHKWTSNSAKLLKRFEETTPCEVKNIKTHTKALGIKWNSNYYAYEKHILDRRSKYTNSPKRRYKQYVALRVDEILSFSGTENWSWVPGNKNPADIATKPHD